MLSLRQPQTPLDGDLVRGPDARSQPLEFYRPPEHIECSAFLSARHKLAVHKVGTNECGYQRMYLRGHRQRILPRAAKECCIQHQNGALSREEQKVGQFYCVGAMQANATLSEHSRVKQDIMIEAGEINTVHSTASRGYPALGLRRRHDTGKLWLHDRHVSWVLPFRLSGYDQDRFQGHTRNRVVLGWQILQSDERVQKTTDSDVRFFLVLNVPMTWILPGVRIPPPLRQPNSYHEPVSYTHLTLPTIYSV